MKNCPLIDLEDSGSEQAGAVTPSLLHQDLAALGKGGVWGEPAQSGPDSQGESRPIPLGSVCLCLERIGLYWEIRRGLPCPQSQICQDGVE